ncbi:hypothetical protein PR202_gb02189 [Eleusine coracana subsp. coracana]|uniref:Uncharacterized protein n=1 Tax=Eleusine coracana subsp. coracana TaxID=191504 RepID=A0AAV5DYI6_ELECO|nr:hypothetical protein PR202_gb02189 [Eleusine coracana subsp. coracana]
MGGCGGGLFTFGWPPMDPAAAFAEFTSGAVPLPHPSASTNGAAYCVNPAMYASVPPHMLLQPSPATTAAEDDAARRRREAEEAVAIHLVHLLVSCADAIQAGDYTSAHRNVADAHSILGNIPTATGIGRVADHFAAALSHRLYPAESYQQAPNGSSASELHHHFYEAGPYLKFAYSTANLAILDAFAGCSRVHVVDLALMQGHQWAGLIHALSQRPGGPPHLRVTGIGPPQTGPRDELREVGFRLAELARSLKVPFSFRGVCSDQLDGLRPWMLHIVPGEALAVNSVLQLHRLLVDPDADPTVPAPIDTLLGWLAAARPRVFTVVEQEADHNRPSLLERFTHALFHYAAIFDSMEDAAGGGGGGVRDPLAEAYLRAEIFDVVCGEGSARAERHELLGRWRERLMRAGMAQLPFGPNALRQATDQLFSLTMEASPGAYAVLECDGSLALGWHNRALYAVSAWRPTGRGAAGDGDGDDTNTNGRCCYTTYTGGNRSNESSNGSGSSLAGTSYQGAAAAAETSFMPSSY